MLDDCWGLIIRPLPPGETEEMWELVLCALLLGCLPGHGSRGHIPARPCTAVRLGLASLL